MLICSYHYGAPENHWPGRVNLLKRAGNVSAQRIIAIAPGQEPWYWDLVDHLFPRLESGMTQDLV